MATDINEELSNIYNAAKQALNDDLKLTYYNAAQTRNQAFRALNNSANANHSLYSGMPAATQMQYDQSTYLPGIATATTRAIAKQKENQEGWDEYMAYVKQLNEQASYYNNLASQASSAAKAMNAAGVGNGDTGFKNDPSGSSNRYTQSGYTDFGGLGDFSNASTGSVANPANKINEKALADASLSSTSLK